MTNEQIVLEKWRALSSEKQQVVLEFINSLSSKLDKGESSYEPKTALGKKLWEIRSQAIANGKIKLLNEEEIEKELAQRRGGTGGLK